MAGPPFSIAGEEVIRHYREAYEVTLPRPRERPRRFRGKLPATEAIWLLERQVAKRKCPSRDHDRPR